MSKKWPHTIRIYNTTESKDSYGEPTTSRTLTFESEANVQGGLSLRDMMNLGVEDIAARSIFIKDPIPSSVDLSSEVEYDGYTGTIVGMDREWENSLEAVFEV